MSYLTEAFKELNIIDEDLFPTDSEGFNKLKDFMKSDIDDEIIVYDADAENEEDLQDSYEGKVILQCDVCKSHFFKEPKNVVIEEGNDLANVGEECCYCHNDMGYKVVGVVAPYKTEEAKEESEVKEEPEVVDAEKEERAEIVHGEKDIDNIDVDANIEVNESLTEAKEEVCPECGKNPCECKEDEEVIDECDAVKEECGEDKEDEEELKEETNYEKVMKVLRAAKKEESLEEDFKDVSITTDDTHMEMTSDENGKVTVTTEPIKNENVPEAEVEAEVIKPLSADEKDKIINKEEDDGQVALDVEDEEDADLDFDEINDDDLNELGEQYFTRVYDNVQSFKSTACKLNESDITLDGELTFKSGKKVNTSFKFNEAFVTKSGKVKLLGENLQFAKNKRAFTLTGTLNEKKLIIEKFTYNYRAKDEKTGKSTKLYGTISK